MDKWKLDDSVDKSLVDKQISKSDTTVYSYPVKNLEELGLMAGWKSGKLAGCQADKM